MICPYRAWSFLVGLKPRALPLGYLSRNDSVGSGRAAGSFCEALRCSSVTYCFPIRSLLTPCSSQKSAAQHIPSQLNRSGIVCTVGAKAKPQNQKPLFPVFIYAMSAFTSLQPCLTLLEWWSGLKRSGAVLSPRALLPHAFVRGKRLTFRW